MHWERISGSGNRARGLARDHDLDWPGPGWVDPHPPVDPCVDWRGHLKRGCFMDVASVCHMPVAGPCPVVPRWVGLACNGILGGEEA